MFDSCFACKYQLTHLKYDGKTNVYILSNGTYPTLSKQTIRNVLTFLKQIHSPITSYQGCFYLS